MTLPWASAKRSRLLPEVFEERSLCFTHETGGTVGSEFHERVDYSIFSVDLAPRALRRLHFVISDFRPPSVSQSSEAALQRLLASRVIEVIR